MGVSRFFAVAASAAAIVLMGAAPSLSSPAAHAQPAAAQPPAATAPNSPTSPAEGASRPLDRTDLEAWLDGVVPYGLKDGDVAGMVIVVVKDGQVLLQKGYGYADVARKTPMDPARSLVRSGSNGKLFTWTAVMQLVEAGKIDLDADINRYLDFKVDGKGGRPITMRDLMNHRGGFEEGLKDVLAFDPKAAQSTEQYLKRHPRPRLFAPGEAPAYSNYGASLAGYIVQRVSGEPFERYVERHILQPLAMANTTFDTPLPDRFKPGLAVGYRTASGPPQPFELVITRPAGSATTTADDMSRFMIAHLQDGRFGDRQILSPQTAQLMHRPSHAGLPGFDAMAHGFFSGTRNGRPYIGHGGDTIFFHTEMNLLPQDGVGIFYTFNSRGKGDAVYALRQSLFDGFMDRYFPAPPAPAPAALPSAKQDAQVIAGAYQSSRRVEHGFISFFYLLQQAAISANPDGTISAPDALGGGLTVFRETGPQIWTEVGGQRQLAFRTVNGVRTIVDSHDPTSVLQAVPLMRSAALTVPILIGSVVVLLLTLMLWALSPLLRRGDRAPSGVTPKVRRLRLVMRGAALVDLVWLFAWFLMLKPILAIQVDVYAASLDPVVRALQVAGLLVLAAAAVGLWCAYKTVRSDTTWLSRIWTVLVAAALLGVAWVGLNGQLIGFNLNY
jgi:CubicO group peptidase (beta-lactamase class C family)